MKPLLFSLLLVLLFLRSAFEAAAQTPTATLSGMVEDETGARLPAAQITVIDLATAFQRHAKANKEGTFVIPLLQPGRYNLTVERSGFTTIEVRQIVLNVNDQLALRIKLKIGEIGETVTVIDNVQSLQESSSVSTIVSRHLIEELPLNGRSFQSLIELAPGTVLSKTNFNEQGQFSINGQRANANYFMVDGVSANIGVNAGAAPGQAAAGSLPALTVLGGTNNLVSLDALQEFRIESSSYAPEYGRTPGAQVSLATRSGTNEIHGSFFEYLRNSALDANDWFANSRGLAKPSLRQNDFGATIGGPFRRNRTFFFFSYEGLRLQQPGVAISEVPDKASRLTAPANIRPFLYSYPTPNGPYLGNHFAEFSASYTDPARFDATSLRIDQIVSQQIVLFGRYNQSPSRTTQRGGVSVPGFNNQSLNTLSRTVLDTQTITFGVSLALTPELLNDLRINWSRAKGTADLSMDDFGGAIPLSPDLIFPESVKAAEAGFQFRLRGGLDSSFGLGNIAHNLQRQINLVDHLTILHGQQQLKFGVDYRRLTPAYNPIKYAQIVTFGDAPTNGVTSAIATGRPFEVRVISGGIRREPVFHNFSAYAQSITRATPRLVITYGLRWELNPPPTERNNLQPFAVRGLETLTDSFIILGGSVPTKLTLAPRGTPLWQTTLFNFAPRAGIAYQLFPKQEIVARGGLGIFYDLGNGQAAQAFGSVFPFARERKLTNVNFPLEPGLAEPPSLDLHLPYGTIYAFAPHLKLPFTLQWNATLEKNFRAGHVFTASYVAAIGRRLLLQYAVLNPSFDFTDLRVTTNNASSDYHALQLRYSLQHGNSLQLHATYTWSHSIDNDSDDSSRFFYTGKKNADFGRGSSNFDIRHAFHGAMTYHLPPAFENKFLNTLTRDWSVSLNSRARSATPLNVYFSTSSLPSELVDARRPDLRPGVPYFLLDRQAPGGRRLNPAAFLLPGVDQGSLGRNALRGFGFTQFDLSFQRHLHFAERWNVETRVEAFNLFNQPNFGEPITDLSNPSFGYSNQMLGRNLGSGGINGGLSPLYQIGGSRSIQLMIKLRF